MTWQLRHAGSPRVLKGLTLAQIVDGLRDGLYDVTDEVLGPGEETWRALEDHPQLAEVAEEVEAPAPGRHDEATSLDLNALIDVCLVLLIFFILTTSYIQMVQKVVPLPESRSQEKGKTRAVRTISPKDVKEQMVRVDAERDAAGRLVVKVQNQPVDVTLPTAEGTTVDPTKMREAIRTYVRGEPPRSEVLLSARGVTWEDVVRIQDAARAAGIQRVHHLRARKKQ